MLLPLFAPSDRSAKKCSTSNRHWSMQESTIGRALPCSRITDDFMQCEPLICSSYPFSYTKVSNLKRFILCRHLTFWAGRRWTNMWSLSTMTDCRERWLIDLKLDKYHDAIDRRYFCAGLCVGLSSLLQQKAFFRPLVTPPPFHFTQKGNRPLWSPFTLFHPSPTTCSWSPSWEPPTCQRAPFTAWCH